VDKEECKTYMFARGSRKVKEWKNRMNEEEKKLNQSHI
jgi:hypothetical protein